MKFKYTVKLSDGKVNYFYGDSTACLPFGARILTIDKLNRYTEHGKESENSKDSIRQ